jgi:hypothetical protein
MRIDLQKNDYMDVSVFVRPFRTFRWQTYLDSKKPPSPRKSKRDARHFQEIPLARFASAGVGATKAVSKKFPRATPPDNNWNYLTDISTNET